MRTLKESILDTNFDISTGSVIFNNFYASPDVVDNDFRADNCRLDDMVYEIIQVNTVHLAEYAEDPTDIEELPDDVVKHSKFKRVISKMKGDKKFCVDTAYQYDIADEMNELYWNCRRKKIGRKEYEQILDDVDLIFCIYEIDGYHFMFLIGDDNVIYGFIGSN